MGVNSSQKGGQLTDRHGAWSEATGDGLGEGREGGQPGRGAESRLSGPVSDKTAQRSRHGGGEPLGVKCEAQRKGRDAGQAAGGRQAKLNRQVKG